MNNLLELQKNSKSETEKFENFAQIEVLSQRILETDPSFIWLELTPNFEYEEIKSFEKEYNPIEQTENIVKAKLYIEAKELGANGIVDFTKETLPNGIKIRGKFALIE